MENELDEEFLLEMGEKDPEQDLQSPFDWQMDDKLASEFDMEMFVNVEDQPIKALMHCVTLVYINVIKKDLMAAYAKVKEMLELLNSMDFAQLQKEKISPKVLVHIVRATKYHYYKARGNLTEAQTTLSEVPSLEVEELQSKIHNGTLNGCKSLSWSVFFDAPKSIAIAYASRALSFSPDCALWHFILGKKLRHLRCDDANFEPLPDETEHFITAYELSKSQYFGVYVAQMYWEKNEFDKAKDISMEIFRGNPQSVGIRLRLALSFIRSKNYDYAKECLDFVQVRCSDNSMYLHYKGIFYEKQKNYQMAALYYNQAAKKNNHKAEIQYAKCMAKINSNFNMIKYLDSMLSKYQKSTTLVQQIFLHIAMQFHFVKKDLKQALEYFHKAIQMSPRSKRLKNYQSVTTDQKRYNVVEFVFNELLPDIHQKYKELPYNLSDIVEDLEKLYSSCTNDVKT